MSKLKLQKQKYRDKQKLQSKQALTLAMSLATSILEKQKENRVKLKERLKKKADRDAFMHHIKKTRKDYVAENIIYPAGESKVNISRLKNKYRLAFNTYKSEYDDLELLKEFDKKYKSNLMGLSNLIWIGDISDEHREMYKSVETPLKNMLNKTVDASKSSKAVQKHIRKAKNKVYLPPVMNIDFVKALTVREREEFLEVFTKSARNLDKIYEIKVFRGLERDDDDNLVFRKGLPQRKLSREYHFKFELDFINNTLTKRIDDLYTMHRFLTLSNLQNSIAELEDIMSLKNKDDVIRMITSSKNMFLNTKYATYQITIKAANDIEFISPHFSRSEFNNSELEDLFDITKYSVKYDITTDKINALLDRIKKATDTYSAGEMRKTYKKQVLSLKYYPMTMFTAVYLRALITNLFQGNEEIFTEEDKDIFIECLSKIAEIIGDLSYIEYEYLITFNKNLNIANIYHSTSDKDALVKQIKEIADSWVDSYKKVEEYRRYVKENEKDIKKDLRNLYKLKIMF